MSEEIAGIGKVTLDIADVRMLLGGFGISHKDMADPMMACLYTDHPAAVKRIAEKVNEALSKIPTKPFKFNDSKKFNAQCNTCGKGMYLPGGFSGLAYCNDSCRLEV